MSTWEDFITDNPDRVACDPAARTASATVGDVPHPQRRKGSLQPIDLVPRSHRSEEEMQMDVISWSKNPKVRARLPETALLFHVPNEGNRHPGVAAKVRKVGIRRGVPDLLLPVPRVRGDDAPFGSGWWHGLAIELKRGRNDVEKDDHQYRWLRRLQRQGWATDVAHSARQTIALIEEYLLDSKDFIPGH